MKNSSSKEKNYFFIYYFSFFIIFFVSFSNSHADISDLFPYKIDFSETQKKILNSLNESILAKLIFFAKTLVQINTNTNNINSNTSNTQAFPNNFLSSQTGLQPNQYIPQQQAYNPYQNQNNRGDNGYAYLSSLANQQRQRDQQNQLFLSNPQQNFQTQNPFLQNSSAQNQLLDQNSNPYISNSNDALQRYLGNSGQTDSGTTQTTVISATSNGFSDFDESKIDPMCKGVENSYGINAGGSCPNVENLTTTVKQTAMEACTLIHKKLPSGSQYRDKNCNTRVGGAGRSRHMKGMALDLSVNGLSSTERLSVFLKFRQRGFNRIGCYRKGSGNIHLDHDTQDSPMRWGPDYHQGSFTPENCPSELIKAYSGSEKSLDVQDNNDDSDEN